VKPKEQNVNETLALLGLCSAAYQISRGHFFLTPFFRVTLDGLTTEEELLVA